MRPASNQVLLTFDVEGPPRKEDFFDETSLLCLQNVLDLLEKNKFTGIFFITGSAAEMIQESPSLLERLRAHEIGYHSSSHTVKPTIIEYTDIASYEEAVEISLIRETSQINPETGQMTGEGGILSLRKIFPHKRIVCFRAPFLAWSPPHLEALAKLGIRFDFSSDISTRPLSFRGITFYPTPISVDGIQATFIHRNSSDIFPKLLTRILLQRIVTVLMMHPSKLTDAKLLAGKVKMKIVLPFLKIFLDQMRLLQDANLVQVTSALRKNWRRPNAEKLNVEGIYRASVRAPIHLLGCNPIFIRSHFIHFFCKDKRENEFASQCVAK